MLTETFDAIVHDNLLLTLSARRGLAPGEAGTATLGGLIDDLHAESGGRA